MHPVIRVISFFILSGFVVFGGVYELGLGLLIVCAVVAFKRFQSVELSLRILKRMKWFFISILILYLWFTPGAPLLDVALPGMPTLEGVHTGLLRVMSLVLVIFTVNYFVTTIARTKLVEAIIWILYPLKWMGVDNRVLALRIALVLELVPRVQNIVLDVKQEFQERNAGLLQEDNPSRRNKLWARLSAAGQLSEQLFVRVLDEAVNMPGEQINLGEATHPPVLQWSVPLVLVVLFLWIKTV